MLKRFFAIALTVCLAVSVCACAKQPGPDSATPTPSPATEGPDTPPETDNLPDDGTHLIYNNEVLEITTEGESGKSGRGTPQLQFTDSVTLTLKAPKEVLFNRYRMTYQSTAPLCCTVRFAGETKEDTVYLESTEEPVSVRFLLSTYLEGGTDTAIVSLSFRILSGEECTLSLSGLQTEKIEPLDTENNTVYLENSYYRIGSYLVWGGGLSTVEYKGNPSYTENLLNSHDTGRLVQQSYYGVGDDSYQPAMYGGNVWQYNPVQGGDQYGNKSRLIDFEVAEDRIYVKCQPLDWAQENLYALCYMENTYSFVEKAIRVDNRFVDFSGYPHSERRHQELPAFYVVSGLSRFVFYDGKNPWTDDKLTEQNDLGFWGDAANHDKCYTTVRKSNDEVWGAWVNEEDFGIGLYMPGTEILLKGRYAFNGSMDAHNSATNYLAPLRTMRLVCYKPLSYSYLICAGNLTDIRAQFSELRTTIDNSALINYNKTSL